LSKIIHDPFTELLQQPHLFEEPAVKYEAKNDAE
jgi:hypothetical protein